MLHPYILQNKSLSHHGCVISEGVKVPHVAVHQTPNVLHLRAQVLIGSVSTQHSDPKQMTNKNTLTSLSPRAPGRPAAPHISQQSGPRVFNRGG